GAQRRGALSEGRGGGSRVGRGREGSSAPPPHHAERAADRGDNAPAWFQVALWLERPGSFRDEPATRRLSHRESGDQGGAASLAGQSPRAATCEQTGVDSRREYGKVGNHGTDGRV